MHKIKLHLIFLVFFVVSGAGAQTVDTFLTDARIDEAVDVYRKTGLLNHISEDEIKDVVKMIKSVKHKQLNDLLCWFPDLVYVAGYVRYDLDTPYSEVMRGLTRVSHNSFKLNKFAQQKIGDRIKFVFVYNGLGYVNVLIPDSLNRIDGEFVKLINAAIGNTVKGAGFYRLCNADGNYAFIYLTKPQYEFLKKGHWMNFSEACGEEQFFFPAR